MAILELKANNTSREGEYVDVDTFDFENSKTIDVEEVLYCTNGKKEPLEHLICLCKGDN